MLLLLSLFCFILFRCIFIEGAFGSVCFCCVSLCLFVYDVVVFLFLCCFVCSVPVVVCWHCPVFVVCCFVLFGLVLFCFVVVMVFCFICAVRVLFCFVLL